MYCCYDVNWNIINLRNKGLNTPVFEQSSDGLPKSFGHILDEKSINTSTNRSFCTSNFAVVTYENFSKELSN